MRKISLDSVDRALLTLIQSDSRKSVEEFGAAVGLSTSAAHRRIQRMRASRVIIGEIALIDPAAVDRPMVMIVSLSVEREGREHLHTLRSWLDAEPAVQQCWYISGEADFIVVVTARDMAEFDEIVQRLVSENNNVRHFHTSVAISTVKRGLSVKTDGCSQDPPVGL
ncbi:Lrp/AsnC family transcriptional regulator [Nocardia sp. NPDC004711]